ncbi:hypothetical protein LQK79_00130 [Clostridium guangxiense]|nr:hypothetical protein [Clostridium guangxiense]
MIMNDILGYINKMNSYIETKNYDAFIKDMDCDNKKYCYFEKFYNEINEVNIKDILNQVIKEKLTHLGLELKDGYYSSDWSELTYSGLLFGGIKIQEKKIKINRKELKDIKQYLFNISCSLDRIENLLPRNKFKKLQEDEIDNYLNKIKWSCKRLTLPNEEWAELKEKLCNQFGNLGFEVIEVSE